MEYNLKLKKLNEYFNAFKADSYINTLSHDLEQKHFLCKPNPYISYPSMVWYDVKMSDKCVCTWKNLLLFSPNKYVN